MYAPGDFDVLALVALDERRIAYLEPEFAAMTIHIRNAAGEGKPGHGKRVRTFADLPFELAFDRWINVEK